MSEEAARVSGPLTALLEEHVPPAESEPVPPAGSVVHHSWLHRELRNIVVLVALTAVVYCALVLRIEAAIMALVTLFATQSQHIFTERTALKQPGKDN